MMMQTFFVSGIFQSVASQICRLQFVNSFFKIVWLIDAYRVDVNAIAYSGVLSVFTDDFILFFLSSDLAFLLAMK